MDYTAQFRVKTVDEKGTKVSNLVKRVNKPERPPPPPPADPSNRDLTFSSLQDTNDRC